MLEAIQTSGESADQEEAMGCARGRTLSLSFIQAPSLEHRSSRRKEQMWKESRRDEGDIEILRCPAAR